MTDTNASNTNQEFFQASINANGAQVHVSATTLDALLRTLAQFGYIAAPDAPQRPQVISQEQAARRDAADAGKVVGVPETKPKKDAAEQSGKPASPAAQTAAQSSTPATASAASTPPAAASAGPVTAPSQMTATTSEVASPNYNDVRARVLAMAKLPDGTNVAMGVLKSFTGVNGQPVDHGNKLQLPDYPAFIAKADEVLKAAGVVA